MSGFQRSGIMTYLSTNINHFSILGSSIWFYNCIERMQHTVFWHQNAKKSFISSTFTRVFFKHKFHFLVLLIVLLRKIIWIRTFTGVFFKHKLYFRFAAFTSQLVLLRRRKWIRTFCHQLPPLLWMVFYLE